MFFWDKYLDIEKYFQDGVIIGCLYKFGFISWDIGMSTKWNNTTFAKLLTVFPFRHLNANVSLSLQEELLKTENHSKCAIFFVRRIAKDREAL